MTRAVSVLLLVVALSGCAKPRVVTQPELPPLSPPAPPARVVTPPEPEEAPPTARPPETPARKPLRTPARPPEPVREPPKVEPPKPAAKPETPPQPENPPTTLQTLGPKEEAQLDGDARRLLAQATHDLGEVKPKSLNADALGQYNQAKRFVDQARQALKDRNFMLAHRLADKAATIAAVLVGR